MLFAVYDIIYITNLFNKNSIGLLRTVERFFACLEVKGNLTWRYMALHGVTWPRASGRLVGQFESTFITISRSTCATLGCYNCLTRSHYHILVVIKK